MINSILDILNADKEVKVITGTYDLPCGLQCRIDDYRTKGYNDDKYYEATKSLFLRRGLAVIYSPPNPTFLLAGMPKFGYYQDEYTDKLPLDSFKLKRRIYTVKENGEAGHLSFFKTTSHWYAIVGSKNVHIVFNVDSEKDALMGIDYYASLNSQRLNGAIANAKLLMRFHANALVSNDEMRLFLFQHHLTVAFEAIFDNHIVTYGEVTLIAYAITEPQFKPLVEQGLVVDPEKALKRLGTWGFRTPQFDVSELANFEEFDRKYESTLTNIEGAVVYEIYENVSTSREIVGRIYKHKNQVYVLRRMAREQIKRKSVYTSWLMRFERCHFDVAGLEEEIEHLLAFYVWLWETKRQLMDNPNSKWGDLVQEHFKDWYQTFESKFGEDREEIEAFLAKAPTTLVSNDGPETLAILLVGLQGSGKTLLRNGLVEMLGTDKIAYVSQDELRGNRKAFLQELRDTSKSLGKILVVDKCNHTCQLRDDVYSNYPRVLICEFVHQSDDEMLAICEERIRQRGLNHQTLPFSQQVKSVISNCFSSCEPVGEMEKLTNDYIGLNVGDKPEVSLKKILDYLCQNRLIDRQEFDLLELERRLDDVRTSYEAKVRKEALKRCKYWRASADVGTIQRLFQPLVPKSESLKFKWDCQQNGPSWRHNGEEYHLTLTYERKLTGNEVDDLFADGNTCLARATSIAFNDKCAAVRIAKEGHLLEEFCENLNPHITLAVADGTVPVYANEMLESGDFEEIPCNFEIELIINPVYGTETLTRTFSIDQKVIPK